MVIRNRTNGSLLAARAVIARNALARLIGLLTRSHLSDGEALVIPQCRSIHTIGMRFPIDVAFVKTLEPSRYPEAWPSGQVAKWPKNVLPRPVSSGETLVEVIAVVQAIRPGRLAGARGADTAIELPSGKLAATATSVGHRLAWGG